MKINSKFYARFLSLVMGLAFQASLAMETDARNAIEGVEKQETLLPLYQIITQPDLLERFKIIDRIGGGGEASVWKVQDKSTRNHYALIVNQEMRSLASPDHRKKFVERLLKNQQHNPHITAIYAYFWIKNPNFPPNPPKGEKMGVLPFQNIKPGYVLNDLYANDPNATPYRHETIVMQLGLADLESHNFRNLGIDPTIIKLMRVFNSISLCMDGIIPGDDKLRNYIYLETATQTYKNQKMGDYDYWRYFSQFYIPKQSYIIKRIDYGNWIHNEPDPMWTKDQIANYCCLSIEELEKFFVPPPEGSTILDIS
jgi:hypothetical protein